MATSALAGLVLASVRSASSCSCDVERDAQRLAGDRLGLEDRHRLDGALGGGGRGWRSATGWPRRRSPSAGDQPHLDAGRAAQLLVVALLQAGHADLVAGHHRPAGLVDDLLGRLADRADDRPGEVPGRRQHLLVLDRQRAGDREHLRFARSARRPRPGTRWPRRTPAARPPTTFAAYALASMSDQPGQPAGRRDGRVAASTADLSMPIRTTGRSSTIGSPSCAQQLAALGGQPALGQPVGAVQLGLDDVRLPVGLPPARVLGQRASVVYAQVCRYAGKGPGRRSAWPWRICPADPRAPTRHLGLSGAHARDQRLEQLVDLGTRWPRRTPPPSGPSWPARPPARPPPGPGCRRGGADRGARTVAGRRRAAASDGDASTDVRRRRRTGPSCHRDPRTVVSRLWASTPLGPVGWPASSSAISSCSAGAVVWALVGIFVHQVVEVLAVPARETARTASPAGGPTCGTRPSRPPGSRRGRRPAPALRLPHRSRWAT